MRGAPRGRGVRPARSGPHLPSVLSLAAPGESTDHEPVPRRRIDHQRPARDPGLPAPRGVRARPTSPAWISTRRCGTRAKDDPEGFWAEQARSLHWDRPWEKVLDWNPPFAKWFVGGRLNASYNCVDRHCEGPNRNKAALIWEGEPGDRRVLRYQDLQREVSKFANVLKGLGVRPGDVVAVYMPLVPELVIALLACARIGAPHTVIFGGFSAESLGGRIQDCKAKVLVTADGGYRRGKVVPLKENADGAAAVCPTLENVDRLPADRRARRSGRPAATTGGTS